MAKSKKNIKEAIEFIQNFNSENYKSDLEILKKEFDEAGYEELSSKNVYYDHVVLRNLSKIISTKKNSLYKGKILYVEVGVFWGRSLLTVANASKNVQCIGVDNNSMSGHSVLCHNLTRSKNNNINYFNCKFQDFFNSKYEEQFKDKTIDLYFYDGNHDYEDQFVGLELVKNYLSNEAIVVVDDAAIDLDNMSPYNAAMDFVSRNSKNFKLIRCLNKKDSISIGMIFLYYNKNGV